MLEFLNQLKPNTKIDPSNGLSGGKQALEAGKGEEFKAMLTEAKQSGDSDLLKALAQNYESSKELRMIEGASENSQGLMDGETEIPTLDDLGKAERKSFFPNSKDSQQLEVNSSDAKLKIEELLAQKKTSGNITQSAEKMTDPKAVLQQSKIMKAQSLGLNTGLEGSKLDSQMTHKIAPQLQVGKTLGKGKSTNQIQYSEDFLSSKITQSAGEKPVITGSRQALNLFQKEQSSLNGGSLFKKSQMNQNAMNTVFDSSAKEQITTNLESAKVEGEVVLDGAIENSSDGLLFTPKTAQATVMTASTNSEVKVLDMSNIKSSDQLISEITNYIESSRLQNGKSLELIVNHQELGQFKVHAQRAGGEMIDLQILAGSDEAQAFFKANEASLLKTLNTNGVKVSDFNISSSLAGSSTSSSSSNGGNDSSGQNFAGSQHDSKGQSNSGQNSHDQGRQRRQELWDQYRERQSA